MNVFAVNTNQYSSPPSTSVPKTICNVSSPVTMETDSKLSAIKNVGATVALPPASVTTTITTISTTLTSVIPGVTSKSCISSASTSWVANGVTHKNSTTQTTATSDGNLKSFILLRCTFKKYVYPIFDVHEGTSVVLKEKSSISTGQNRVRHQPLPDIVKSTSYICPKHSETSKQNNTYNRKRIDRFNIHALCILTLINALGSCLHISIHNMRYKLIIILYRYGTV